MVTVWSNSAKRQLQKAYEYIKLDSLQNAVNVRNEIISRSVELAANPEIFPADKYKQNNDGSYRAFELYSYRISYKIQEDQIRIVRLRHTSRSPKNY